MDGQIGVSIAPEWFWINKIEGQDFSDYGQTRFYLTVDGANYFGENGSFGIEYGLGLIFPINTWQGDVTIDANVGRALHSVQVSAIVMNSIHFLDLLPGWA